MENDNFKEQFRQRAAAIMTAPEAKLCPGLADHLAYQSDLDLDLALGAMKAWKVDYDNQQAMSGTESFIERKTAAGTLGLVPFEDAAASGGWDRATTRAHQMAGIEDPEIGASGRKLQ